MRDGFDFGTKGFSLSTKSCQTMLDEVDEGENPGRKWGQVAVGQDWTYHMNLASSQAARSGLLGSAAGDIVQAQDDVKKDSGSKGVDWTHGSRKNPSKAGGKSQPEIYVVKDTVIAGYNVLIGNGRSYDDSSVPNKTDQNARLVNDFSAPLKAAAWVTQVIGEQEMTTYPGGEKNSIPGIGLLNFVQAQSKQIKKDLTDLVTGEKPINLDNLTAVSAPKVMINSSVINMLQKQSNRLLQAIYVDKIAQEIAVARVIDKAKMGLQLLQVGSQVPPIFSNNAAQQSITNYEKRLSDWIANLRANPKDNSEFVGNTIATLMQNSNDQIAASAAIRPEGEAAPAMENGAIKAPGH
jgi:integrating conjugative element protein (TIGR03755 family)